MRTRRLLCSSRIDIVAFPARPSFNQLSDMVLEAARPPVFGYPAENFSTTPLFGIRCREDRCGYEELSLSLFLPTRKSPAEFRAE
jgi:hypothetical protein